MSSAAMTISDVICTPKAQLIANALNVPLTYLYCEDDHIAALLLALHRLGSRERDMTVRKLMGQLSAG